MSEKSSNYKLQPIFKKRFWHRTENIFSDLSCLHYQTWFSLSLPGLSWCYKQCCGRPHCCSVCRSHPEKAVILSNWGWSSTLKAPPVGWCDSTIVGGFNTIIRVFSNIICDNRHFSQQNREQNSWIYSTRVILVVGGRNTKWEFLEKKSIFMVR